MHNRYGDERYKITAIHKNSNKFEIFDRVFRLLKSPKNLSLLNRYRQPWIEHTAAGLAWNNTRLNPRFLLWPKSEVTKVTGA